MSTTTIRLSDDLKARVSVAASRSGTTTHGFILEAIAEKTLQAELQDELDRVAEQRYASILSSGKTIPWEEMRQYLEARSAGLPAQHPKVRKLAG